MVVYGNANGSGSPMLPNLTPANVNVNYSQFALNNGTVSVSVTNYQFQFVIPIVGTTITMPSTPRHLQVKASGSFRQTCRLSQIDQGKSEHQILWQNNQCQSQVSNPLPGGTSTTPAFRTSLRREPALQHRDGPTVSPRHSVTSFNSDSGRRQWDSNKRIKRKR